MDNTNIENLKSLPKVEVSFQDDFNKDTRNYTITPKYVLRKLGEIGVHPKIGDAILFWEDNPDIKGNNYYLCCIGKIMNAWNNQKVLAVVNHTEEMAHIDSIPVFIEVDLKEIFELPGDTPVFK